MVYDSIIVGGGIAGLQAAIQLGRYEHRVLVVDGGSGRSTLCRSYHNVLGWPDGVAGTTLRDIGRSQAERLGVDFAADEIIDAVKRESDGAFMLYGMREPSRPYEARTLLLATGLVDRMPELPGLVPCLGLTVYVCPDCDGYEVRGRRTAVLGSGDTGAEMALLLAERASATIYINHEQAQLKAGMAERLQAKGIVYYAEAIAEVATEGDGALSGVRLAGGRFVPAERGFVAFGGNRIRSELAAKLGVERMENKHIATDPRTKMTSVPNVWAAGDVAVHAEQVTIAMGEGTQAAIWMHKALVAMADKPVFTCP